MNVSIDNLADAVMKELEAYSAEATLVTKQAVEEVAEDCKNDISNNAPGSGKYKKSWKKKLAYSSATESRYTVYSTKYQLTHLLEYGHEKWLWGDYTGERVKAIPHIRPAEEKAEQNLINKIKRGLS